MSVELIRDGRPALSDIPARLRLLANELPAGTSAAIVVLLTDNEPQIYGFGDVPTRYHAAGIISAGLHEVLKA